MKYLSIDRNDKKEFKRFVWGLVFSGGAFVIHPTVGRIILGLTIASSASHIIDRIVEDDIEANTENSINHKINLEDVHTD